MRRPVGVNRVLSLFCGTRFFLPPSGHCRHASIRTLEERFVSLGARWAFSVQPVLPSVWRPWVLLFASRTWARRLTQPPETRLFDFLFPEMFLFMLRAPTNFAGCCAAARTLLRSPISDAATPPAFWLSQRWLASSHSSHLAPLASSPNAAGRNQSRTVPGCAALPAPADVHLRFALAGVSPSWL